MLRKFAPLAIIGILTVVFYGPQLKEQGLSAVIAPLAAKIRSNGSATNSSATVSRGGDGDTCTLSNGDRVRLLDIDAPELGGARCSRETAMAVRARDRLSSLVVGNRVELRRSGRRDQYDRLLADLVVDGHNAGSVLMSEGLAVRWRPGLGRERPGPWC